MAFDDVSQRMAGYAEPPLKLPIEKLEFSASASVLDFSGLAFRCSSSAALSPG